MQDPFAVIAVSRTSLPAQSAPLAGSVNVDETADSACAAGPSPPHLLSVKTLASVNREGG
ncbi:hypothetical protein DEG02_007830 [Xanthomonas vasicola]|nr:hypothetical protein KWO_014110 [Xanthomonas vasicola pv. musacearum NCPPB 4379]RJL87970.1 hypothetical protein DEG03_001570 [Xanthomonas vasicola]RRJ44814.1 hypothetical protein EIM46_01265 [Xanthomonas vasicola pv. musacearum]RJL89999.1 hypothetical protein DEF98_000305 [Xanthomonas vasicola]RJL91830.1 hypothetical protein DEF95_003975 [Xanthomonas vasicola]